MVGLGTQHIMVVGEDRTAAAVLQPKVSLKRFVRASAESCLLRSFEQVARGLLDPVARDAIMTKAVWLFLLILLFATSSFMVHL